MEHNFFSEMQLSPDFCELELKVNSRTGNQIKDWISEVSLILKKEMEDWDWSKPFEVELPDEPEIDKFYKLLSAEGNPDALPGLGYMQLYKSSKVTDFVTGSFLSQYGLIISQSAKEIFEAYNLGEARFYPITLEHNGNFYSNYFFLKTLSSAVEFIDYRKSCFYKQRGFSDFDTREVIEIDSIEEYEDYRKNLSDQEVFIYMKSIALNDSFPNYDYFTCDMPGMHKRFVSSKLASALNKLSGLQIIKTNRIFK